MYREYEKRPPLADGMVRHHIEVEWTDDQGRKCGMTCECLDLASSSMSDALVWMIERFKFTVPQLTKCQWCVVPVAPCA